MEMENKKTPTVPPPGRADVVRGDVPSGDDVLAKKREEANKKRASAKRASSNGDKP